MSATDELRRLLDEQDVTYTMRQRLANGPNEIETKFYLADEDNRGYAIIDTECSVPGGVTLTVNVTPKQAVEILARRGTCEDMSGGDPCVFICSYCGAMFDHPEHERVCYCLSCGRRVADDCR